MEVPFKQSTVVRVLVGLVKQSIFKATASAKLAKQELEEILPDL